VMRSEHVLRLLPGLFVLGFMFWFMFWEPDTQLLLIGGAIYFFVFYIARKLLVPIFLKSEERQLLPYQTGTTGGDFKLYIVQALACAVAGWVVTSGLDLIFVRAYPGRTAWAFTIILVSLHLIVAYGLLACWLDEKLNLLIVRGLFIALAIAVISYPSWKEGSKEVSKEDSDYLESTHEDFNWSLYFALGNLKPKPKDFAGYDELQFTHVCVRDFIYKKYSTEDIVRITQTIRSNRRESDLTKQQNELPSLSYSVDGLPMIRERVAYCEDLLDELKPEFQEALAESELFSDLRPDLAKSAKEGFYGSALYRGPKTFKRYMSFLKSIPDKENWLDAAKQYGVVVADIEWEYDRARCVHSGRDRPAGNFITVAPHEPPVYSKVLREARKKCRQELNLPAYEGFWGKVREHFR